MATYVLVHGGWSGAHGFRHVRRSLQAAGHEVFTPSQAFWAAAEHARTSPGWRYREIDTNHMVPNNRPRELAELLLELS